LGQSGIVVAQAFKEAQERIVAALPFKFVVD